MFMRRDTGPDTLVMFSFEKLVMLGLGIHCPPHLGSWPDAHQHRSHGSDTQPEHVCV